MRGMNNKHVGKPFLASSLSLSFARTVGRLDAKLRARDRDLARQLKRATSSIALNVAEASGRLQGDRRHLFSVAYGSAREARAALELAVAYGDLPAAAVEPGLAELDRLCGMLYRLSR